jgi:protein arginine kinase activator
MKCQKCNSKIASVLIRQTIAGKDHEYKLCSDCAKEIGLLNHFDPSNDYYLGGGLFASQFLTALNSIGINGQYKPGEVIASRQGEACCTKCKTTLEEMRQSGRLGCSNCYKAFEDQLVQVFRRIQSGEMHRGRKKAEKIESSEIKLLRGEILDLQDRIRDAVVIEDYESAAKWKTRILQNEELIKGIEKSLGSESENDSHDTTMNTADSINETEPKDFEPIKKSKKTDSMDETNTNKRKSKSTGSESGGIGDGKPRKNSKSSKAKPKEGEDVI